MAGLTMNGFAPLATEAAALVEDLRESVVVVRSGHGHGSGVIWESDGLIVTNHHVAGREHAEVELADGRRLAATVTARDPGNDLAALRIPARDLPAAPVGDSTALRVGELIVAVGYPFGVRGTATLGIVSAVGSDTWMGRSRRELLQADVSLAPGNSGGPLANSAGAVVGVASMVVSPGIALAIPSHVVTRFLESRFAERPVLGVTLRPVLLQPGSAGVPPAWPKRAGRPRSQGLMLLEIYEGSAAEAAGLLPGDVLLELEGRPIRRPADLTQCLAGRGSDPLRLTLLRGGTVRRCEVNIV